MQPHRSWCALAAAVCLAAAWSPSVPASDTFPIAFTQSIPDGRALSDASVRLSLAAHDYREGMRVVTATFPSIEASARVVSSGFACATDPAFDHTGTQLLFSGARQSGDRLQVWHVASAGAEPSRAFQLDADCLRPRFLADRRIAFASNRDSTYEEHGGAFALSIYAAGVDRQSITRLTHNPSSEFDPVVLPDGRILFSSWQHVGNYYWPSGNVALLLTNSDGTGVFPLTGNHREPRLKRRAAFVPPDRIVFVQADETSDLGTGALVATSLNDAFAPYSTLVSARDYEVHSAAPLSDGRLVVSAKPTNRANATFALYTWSEGGLTPLYDDAQMDELMPAVGAAVPAPERRISTVDPDKAFGHLTILNVFETDRENAVPLSADTVAAVRVIEGMPLRDQHDGATPFVSVPGRDGEPLANPAGATGYIPGRILGEIPPAADGSVHMKVPADRPLRIQLIDRDGFAVMNERAWFWVRPGERRLCIGCHENRELSAYNVAPLAAKRTPTDLTEPHDWRTVTFQQDIAPILAANCALSGCHVPPTPTAMLNMSTTALAGNEEAPLSGRFHPAYVNLLTRQKNKPFSVGGRRVHPGNARQSPMLWMLYGRPLGPQYKPAPFDRPMVEAHPGPMLPETQLELIRTWIDLGAVYDDNGNGNRWNENLHHAQSDAAEKPDGTR